MGLTPGANFGRYRVDQELGSGGWGVVFRAFDTILERAVALKIIKGDRDMDGEVVARFLREARLGAQLAHPNTATVYDAGVIDGTHFIAMEYVKGRAMRDFIRDHTVDITRRVRWLADVARGLVAAHALGILHRDLKANNVIVQDVTDVAKVLDFGLAKRRVLTGDMRRTFQTQVNFVVGTPMYMAPEQLLGEKIDARADQFAWGLLAYLLIVGKNPRDDDPALLKPPPRVDKAVQACPRRVADVIERSLAIERNARFSAMSELLSAFEKSFAQDPQLLASGAGSAVVVRLNEEPHGPPIVGVPVQVHVKENAPPDPNAWRFHLRETKCPIAPLTGACISDDGRRALGFSTKGLATFDGEWKVLPALPQKTSPGDILCAAALPEGGYVVAGRSALLYSLNVNGDARRILIEYRDLDKLTFRGVFAQSVSAIDLVGSWRESGVVVTLSNNSSRVLPCLVPLAGVSRGESLFVCGPKGVLGFVDDKDTLHLHPRAGGDLVGVVATKDSAFACGKGAWLLAFRENEEPQIESIETMSNLTAIAARDGEAWVASEKGRFLRREGATWKRKSPSFVVESRALALWVSRERLTSVTASGAIITATPRRG